MIKEGLYRGLTEGFITRADLYGLTDETFYAGFNARPEPPFELIRRVYDRRLHDPIADIAFDDANPAHCSLEELAPRAALQRRLRAQIESDTGRRVDPSSVLIDIPEAISFEVSFPVIDGTRIIDYPHAGTVFTRPVIEDFTRTLRRIRLMVEPAIASDITNPRCSSPMRSALRN